MFMLSSRGLAPALTAALFLAFAAPFASAADPLPDLVVKSASAQLGKVCDSSGPVISIIAEIANVGDASSHGRVDAGAVIVVDKYAPWTGGVGLPDIQPGASVTVTIPLIAYDPANVAGLHRFTVWVNRDKKIVESDYKNNQGAPFNVTVPGKLCGQ